MSDPVMNPDALAANRRGELSEQQVQNMGIWSRSKHKDALNTAAWLIGGALVVAIFASSTSSPLLRAGIIGGCLAIAAFLVLRSLTGTDAFTQDVKEGRVESVEGAIGKHHLAARGGPAATAYFVDVGDTRFHVSASISHVVPDAGFARMYYLPRSKKIVNCERLPSGRVEPITAQTARDSIRDLLTADGRLERNEVRARMADISDAFDQAVSKTSATTAPAGPPDGRQFQRDIVGSWRNALMHVRFSADGIVAANVFGKQRDGHWSVDAAGRLTSDITGRTETVDAWIAGTQLTIVTDGETLTFTRDA